VIRVAVTGSSRSLQTRIIAALFGQRRDDSLRLAARGVADAAGADVVVLASSGSRANVDTDVSRARARWGDAPLVAVVESPSNREVRRLLDSGVLGVVLESNLNSTLVPTVRVVCAGQLALPPVLRPHIERPVLSHREREVTRLAAQGYKNAQIAAELYLAESTIKSHLSSAFAKLGVTSRHEVSGLLGSPDAEHPATTPQRRLAWATGARPERR
jgi:DNA-binding NarL/FixJ family response regulator